MFEGKNCRQRTTKEHFLVASSNHGGKKSVALAFCKVSGSQKFYIAPLNECIHMRNVFAVQENERVKHIECTFWRFIRQQVRWTWWKCEFTVFGKQSANRKNALTTATVDHSIYSIEHVSRSAWQCLAILFGTKPFNWFSNCCKKEIESHGLRLSIDTQHIFAVIFYCVIFWMLDMRYRIELITIPVYCSVWTRFSRLLNSNPPLDSYR